MGQGLNIWRITIRFAKTIDRYNLSVTFTMGRVICLDDRVGRRSSRTVSTYNVFLWWPKKTTHHPSIGLNIWKIFSYHVTKSTGYDLSVTFAMGRLHSYTTSSIFEPRFWFFGRCIILGMTYGVVSFVKTPLESLIANPFLRYCTRTKFRWIKGKVLDFI